MAATAALPKTILITLPVSSNNNNQNLTTFKIGQKRSYSLITQTQPMVQQQQPMAVTLVNPPTSHQPKSHSPPAIWLPATTTTMGQQNQKQPSPLRQYKMETIDDDDDSYQEYSNEDDDTGDDYYPDGNNAHMMMIQYANEHEQPPRKRERLTHLTTEEKMYRRKLKNRIAAQTARDRKKAMMGDLEDKVRLLEEDNVTLLVENKKLRRDQTSLAEENERLKKMLNERGGDGGGEMKPTTVPTIISSGSVAGRVGARTVDAVGPAESINVPLPKEQAKTTNATTWLLASALIQIYSSCCVKSLPKEQQLKVVRELEQLKENNSLTLEDVINRSPPEAIKKLESIIRAYSKPP